MRDEPGSSHATGRRNVESLYVVFLSAVFGLVLFTAFGYVSAICNVKEDAETLDKCSVVLQNCLPGHPQRARALCGLAKSLFERFQELGIIDDLDQFVLEFCSPGYPYRSLSSSDLACSLRARFLQLGAMHGLEWPSLSNELRWDSVPEAIPIAPLH
ncbi:hypothetical protein HYDPIDRAFT_171670 [Hydnomerulius pinastri MD-312]|uniref:Uncharacterized protein n=1 Tax=Hydnomerulius pinastri MD-312 TaxID=994086 RepID=A0A0C2KJD3_9AGAM|nr:hypothetical protein HYDPIDRAFT_171670 [Hydnomerulius pinastri MD-312]